MKYAIHWFRRDLRVAGNPALQQCWKKHDGKVVGIFCFDKKFLSRSDFSINRFQLFLEGLKALRQELKKIGSDLLFLDIGPEKSFANLFDQLKKQNLELPTSFSWNRDYEPFARKRDEAIHLLCKDYDVQVITERDHLLIEPHEVYRQDDVNLGYQVYTPYSKKWLEVFASEEVQKRVAVQKKSLSYLSKALKGDYQQSFKLTWKKVLNNKIELEDKFSSYYKKNSEKTTIPIPQGGSIAAFERLKKFKNKIDDYGDNRDVMSLEGTSRLSPYFKNGSLTIAQVIAYFDLRPYSKKKTGRDIFFSELIWREFYYHILHRNPQVENQSFNAKYLDLEWENDKDLFDKWKEGKTGFPIIDAGMRELNNTGLMHNRVRMIVASFLTKDLLIDWRWGEEYFMKQLLDGDLAPNNGGWQWAASTGCDPQPYFRIFNPWLQSKRFDPEGEYIKHHIPELANVEAKKLHGPILDHDNYPRPIVEHKQRREMALNLYKRVRDK